MKPASIPVSVAIRISVVIPVRNGERYLREAIDSVLAQTLLPFEVIVVNDGSTDRSGAILDSYGAALLRIDQPNAGTAAARNAGVRAARGDTLAFLDQDDLWSTDKLRLQSDLLLASPSTQLAWGSVQQFISPELPAEFARRFRCPTEPMQGYLPSALLIRRDAFDRIGPFDPRWRIGEWADWFARCVQAGLASEHVAEVVTYRRIHEGNKGVTMASDRGEYIRLIREKLRRSRTE